ncbi:FadR/GntR family transcriptional regulator [Henriciella mobilis]|uniref:FadR family transcriptional regulator n=1 Tax=Henriciella mobilis TaxID=2305467 RepID=A0A399RE20_9PROT|nr:GntR family transcriptional regulator [Henriciella mobilis]RIJ17262.1 FadR family transcriptional regulator [Henriciella mobilis]RIJ22391.1 FadR family transcriptional regulator [Henriciella mobilis]RIJ29836.1 FadR family transcriptional regulator [Henriciella mobilis]
MVTKTTAVSSRTGARKGTTPRIRTPKTSEVVADQIRAQIVRGELVEGDTLPPEGQLMETLGVSRPTLREAYRILEAENFISVTRGSRSGAQVHQPQVEVAARYAGYILQSQGTTIADLYASQMAIEPFTVRSLCRMRNNKAAVTALSEHCEYLVTLIEDERIDAFTKGVAEFHSLLVKLTGNKTLTLITQLLQDLMANHKADLMRRDPIEKDARKKRLNSAIKSYRKLIKLIADKEEEAAVAHWRLHLKNAHASWARAGEGERVVDAINAY